MINLLEGVPGSGKSYEAVVYHVLPALKMGRKVITNLPLNMAQLAAIDPGYLDLVEIRKSSQPVLGTWDAEAANRGEQAFCVGKFDQSQRSALVLDRGRPTLRPQADQRLFGGVWDFYDEWRGEGNIGALFVIDECHVSFPKESLRKGRFTPDEVIQWFKISRHFGVDVLLMTQRMRALDDDVAGLAEMHIRVRKATFLGRSDQYVRKVFAGLNGGEVSSDLRPYKPQYFGLYKSHTQGAAVIEASAQDVKPSNVKWRRLSYTMFAIAALGAVFVAKRAFYDEPKKPQMVGFRSTAVAATPATPPPLSVNAPVQTALNNAPTSGIQGVKKAVMTVAESGPPEPLKDRGLHLAGCLSMGSQKACLVSVSQNGVQVFTITQKELEVMGYTFSLNAECVATVTWAGFNRMLLCDLPQIGQGIAGVTTSANADSGPVVRSVPLPAEQPEQKQPVSQWASDLAKRNQGVRSTLVH